MSDIYYSTIKGIFEASELEALSDREKVGGLGTSTARDSVEGVLEAEGRRPGVAPDDNIAISLQAPLSGVASDEMIAQT